MVTEAMIEAIYPAKNCHTCGRISIGADNRCICDRFKEPTPLPMSGWCCRGWKSNEGRSG